MTRQLATMVSSGMTILRALYVLEEQTENKLLATIIADVRKDVEAGLPLSDALRAPPEGLQRRSTSRWSRAGETGGVLEESLMRVADQLEKDDALRRQVKSAMVYPTVVMTFALHRADRASSPSSSRCSSASSSSSAASCRRSRKFTVGALARRHGLLVGLSSRVAVGAVWAFRKWKQPTGAARSGTAFRLRIPMKIGDIVQKVALARWSRTLSALVAAGVPILAGARDHRPDRRQPRRREGDGRRHRVGQARRHDRRARCKDAPGLPGDGRPDGRRRRGDRRPGHDALEDRRLLRGPGRRRPSRR